MKTTRYFEEQVLRKRPYLTLDMCAVVVSSPLEVLTQGDGRIRFWGRAQLPDQAEARILRVVTLADGETIHNAFFDRNFRLDDQ